MLVRDTSHKYNLINTTISLHTKKLIRKTKMIEKLTSLNLLIDEFKLIKNVLYLADCLPSQFYKNFL